MMPSDNGIGNSHSLPRRPRSEKSRRGRDPSDDVSDFRLGDKGGGWIA